MADKAEPKNLGQENKKPKWLQEVEDDAVRITLKRYNDQQEEKAYRESQKEKQA